MKDGIIYSQNELNNRYLTTIQLVIILGYLIYRKAFPLVLIVPINIPAQIQWNTVSLCIFT